LVNDTVKAKLRPSDQLAGLSHIPRVAVVGCGYWGKNLVRNFAELGALAGICDPDRATAERLAGASGSRVFEWTGLLGDSAIEGIAIAAPAALHFQLARAALEAGKHVFVEKPLALEVAEAEKLCEIADRAGRRLMVGHLLQYHPAFLKLKELVTRGTLGRLQYIYSNRLNLGKIRREEDIQIMFPGRYNDILEPGRHYLALEPDFSNIDAVMARFRDPAERERLTEAAHAHIMGAHTYSHRMAELAAILSQG
jgi:hypothetical protein